MRSKYLSLGFTENQTNAILEIEEKELKELSRFQHWVPRYSLLESGIINTANVLAEIEEHTEKTCKVKERLLLEYEGTGYDSFEEFLLARNDWVDYCFEQSELRANDLEKLLMKIKTSGLLNGTEFEESLLEIYNTLDA